LEQKAGDLTRDHLSMAKSVIPVIMLPFRRPSIVERQRHRQNPFGRVKAQG
jgi:hypothetical protein